MRARGRWATALVASLVAALAGCAEGATMPMHRQATRGLGPSMMGSPPAGYRMHSLTCAAPAALPGALVRVMLGDMGLAHVTGAPTGSRMMLRAVPATIPAGRVSFVVANMGWREHEMVVLPLPSGGTAGDRVPGRDGRVDETGSLGEASASCGAGAGEGIEPGAVGWVTLDLAPGRYELVCNLPRHYASGMRQALVVG